ncbi:Pkinase-domain-containing protein [Roridomyces roridus]|uniref:Pkinase-domain-containing protein n=1 Tax=Roridomyces roridus TaxID=1738132 RepID=A0AAD7BZG2_9AGAR|nr:Pkinase-domain-containing protein [Roridomyces roridus]
MAYVSTSPPRAPPIQYTAPLGTRWAKEVAAAGGVGAFDLPSDPKAIGPWILGECVGKGASGRVKIAKHKVTGQLAAVKILPLAPLVNSRASLATQQAKTDKQRLGIDREITMMKLMNHPNIMRIYDVYEGAKELFLVLEYVEGGELFDFLVNRGRLPGPEALEYFKQIVYGLSYAHTFSIIHRDLKPENILIASLSPPLIKIADWGMATFAPPTLQLETSCGSPHYASPEIVNGERYQGNATDIWSCGVILYALLTGRLPFDDKNVKVLLSKVKSGKYEMPNWIDPLAMDLLARMLVVDVSRRITIPEILCHPWLHSVPTDSLRLISIPPLPPSPSTLARPLDHPSLIDPELFASLRIIWGRHADAHGESIKRDLCSPAGRGVHAKAFYFLLGRYRDESLRARTAGENVTSSDMIAIDGIESMKFDLGWQLDLNGGTTRPYSQRSSSVVPTRIAPSPLPQISGLAPPLMCRTPTVRERPASPAGPRAHSRKHEESYTIVAPRPRGGSSGRPVSSLGTNGGPRPPPPRRGHTYSTGGDNRVQPRWHQRSLPADPGLPQDTDISRPVAPPQFLRQPHAARSRSNTSPHPSPLRSQHPSAPRDSAAAQDAMIHSPVPVLPSVSNPIVKMDLDLDLSLDLNLNLQLGAGEDMECDIGFDVEHEELPLLTAPRTSNAELQKTMDAVAERLNGLVKAQATSSSPVLPSVPLGHRRATNRTVSRPAREDKENQSVTEEGWSYVGSEEYQSGVGLGVNAVDARVGREMGNVVFLPEAKREKERKGKHTTLPPLKPKRSTISLLASPITTANNHLVPDPNATTSRLTSPVVGEFKGWFSNLFNWKSNGSNQPSPGTGVIYSPDGLEKTRREVGLLCERLGIVVEGSGFSFAESALSPDDDGMALRCKVEENSVDGAPMVLKPVRFRVEFSAAPCAQVSTYQDAPPNHKHHSTPHNYPSSSLNALLAAPLDGPLKNRASSLMNRNISASSAFPPGCLSAIVMVHEKGSASTFKNVWKRLKETYASGNGASHGYPSMSPAVGFVTPYMEQPQRFAL